MVLFSSFLKDLSAYNGPVSAYLNKIYEKRKSGAYFLFSIDAFDSIQDDIRDPFLHSTRLSLRCARNFGQQKALARIRSTRPSAQR